MSVLRFLVAVVALAAPAALAQVPASAASAASGSQAARVAGKVVLVEGDALFFDRAGALRSARAGDLIHEGDRVLTHFFAATLPA